MHLNSFSLNFIKQIKNNLRKYYTHTHTHKEILNTFWKLNKKDDGKIGLDEEIKQKHEKLQIDANVL